MKAENKTRSLVILTLALAQCALAAGCARTAMLDSAKKAAVLNARAAKEKSKQSGLAANQPVASPSPAASPKPGDSLAAASAPTFAASLGSVDLDVDAKTGTARLNFGYTTSAEAASVGPLVAQLSAVAAPSGAEMDPPLGVLGYSAHLSCKTADCSSATLALSKLQAPLAGKSLIHFDRFPLTRQNILAVGTPKGFDSNVVTAFKTQGKIDTYSTITKIENGATFFRVDSRFPNGAIVPGQPSSDNGRRVILKGTIGENVTISVSYVDTDSDVAAGTRQDYKGTATYSETAKTIHVEFSGVGSDGIQSFNFDVPSI